MIGFYQRIHIYFNTISPSLQNEYFVILLAVIAFWAICIGFAAWYQILLLFDPDPVIWRNIPWRICEHFGLSRSKYQIFKTISLPTVLILLFILVALVRKIPPIIIGSFLGVLPALIIEWNNICKNPYVVLSEVKVTKYPKEWYTFGSIKSAGSATNSIGVHAILRNEGRGVAEDCVVKLGSNSISEQEYHTRWEDVNPVKMDLSPGESQVADLFWVDLEYEHVQTANPNRDRENEEHYPPGTYEWIERPELSIGDHRFDVLISAANMRQRQEKVTISDSTTVSIPDAVMSAADEWSVIQTLKEHDEGFAIIYNKYGKEVMEIPRSVRLVELQRIDELSKERFGVKTDSEYEEYLKDEYTIDRV
ncbi:hypothetical protein [Natrinema pallidum]|uniref:Uncharacterized protein n=1 Tax=Natrinema pallidum TaxID=69527 RepID=A0A4P9TJ43_9EURY|nr:hypothetical protein [Natrinema pallidum]QCW04195.1 hypothetical protein FGF80_13540 [Natrinema pallidum]